MAMPTMMTLDMTTLAMPNPHCAAAYHPMEVGGVPELTLTLTLTLTPTLTRWAACPS